MCSICSALILKWSFNRVLVFLFHICCASISFCSAVCHAFSASRSVRSYTLNSRWKRAKASLLLNILDRPMHPEYMDLSVVPVLVKVKRLRRGLSSGRKQTWSSYVCKSCTCIRKNLHKQVKSRFLFTCLIVFISSGSFYICTTPLTFTAMLTLV